MSNIPQGYKPFNYEEAIKDLSKVRTRNGRSVIELYKFNTIGVLNVAAAIEDESQIVSYKENGRFFTNENNSVFDLFLIDDSKIVIQIPEDTSIEDFAKEVANIIINDYGMHNQNPFIKTLLDELYKQG